MGVKLITQFVVLPQEDGNVCILKHMHCPDLKLGKATVESLCYSAPQTLKWQGHAMSFRKGWQWFLEQLGGWQCRQYALANVLPNQSNRGDKGAHLSSLSEDSVDKGFQFIEEEAGRLGSEWKRVQWITKHVSINQDSPIFSWPLALVEKSLRALQNDGVLALPVEDFYFTLADIHPSLLDFAIQHLVKNMKTIAIGILGGPGSGKIPLARILALCASRYWNRELQLATPPSFREACEFVFFRGQPGRKDRPDIHDDGSLASEPIRKTKGFADVGCTMMTKERWGAAKFVQGQLRVFVCNDYALTDLLRKKQDSRAGPSAPIPHSDFLDIIAPMFPKDTEDPHKMAVLKCASILVNAGKVIVLRQATQDEVHVPCIIMDKAVDFLKPAAAARYMNYRDTKESFHADFERDVEWESKYVDAVLHGRAPPPPRATIDHSNLRRLFHGVLESMRRPMAVYWPSYHHLHGGHGEENLRTRSIIQ